jgi:hypothetical protein
MDMIVEVKVTSRGDLGLQRAEMCDVFDDGERHITHKMTVTRAYGESSCTNPEGTNGKIEIYGDFTYKENNEGIMVIDGLSQDALDNAIPVFKAIFGEKYEE